MLLFLLCVDRALVSGSDSRPHANRKPGTLNPKSESQGFKFCHELTCLGSRQHGKGSVGDLSCRHGRPKSSGCAIFPA